MKLLSIIIPVYKVEKYVGATLQSIVDQRQDLFDYEVIVVDDGTPDKSMDIVESYSPRMPQMLILHQENKGLSGARNTGLRHATGKYVWFVDSDDTISDGIFASFATILPKEEAEVIGFDVDVSLDGVFQRKERPFSKRKYFRYNTLRHTCAKAGLCLCTGMAQRFLFRRDFCIANNLSFLEGVIFEDVEFMVRVRCITINVAIYNITSYNYLKRSSDSIMSTPNMRAICSRMYIRDNWEKYMKEPSLQGWQRSLLNRYCFNITCRILSQHSVVKTKEYIDFYNTNRWKQTKKGIQFFIHSFGFHGIRDYLKLFCLVFNPKLNSIL